ncbi:MAG: hypothetical protein HWN66_14845 [Candidatus Helarchaeota archaeon]|nr:hypothetical protein [Candidatus Helarchaeota archaeon]
MSSSKIYNYQIFSPGKVGLLSDNNYYTFLLDSIRNAERSIYAVIFIINIRQIDDPNLHVLALLKEIEYAMWRGVDTKIIIGSSEKSPIISIVNEITYRYLRSKNIPVKYASLKGESLHSKYVIIDSELVLLGSHNWSNNAFFRNKEDSIFCYSSDCAINLTKEFQSIWETGRDVKI